MEELFLIQQRYDPEVFFVEDGVIWKSVSPTLYREMQRRDIWLSCFPINPTRDKATRGRPLQKRMRAGAMRFDKEASWYPGYEAELLRFTAGSDAALDDQFDSSATLVLGLDQLPDLEEDDFKDEEDAEMERQDPRLQGGRSKVTGY
jgi:predicted phage terminase large subunit-like protein